MGKIIAFNFISLDGYFEGPSKGDTSWHIHGNEENEYANEMLQLGNILLFGRVTYQIMFNYWSTPFAINYDPFVAERMYNANKIVFSKKLVKPDWNNTILIKDQIEEEIRKMKQLPGTNMAK